MAATATAAAVAVSFPSSASRNCHRRSFSLKRRSVAWTRCSATGEADGGNGGDSGSGASVTEIPSGTSRGLSSLISTDNVQKALRGIAITDADHYGRLDITRGTSYDEVTVAYKKKCEELLNKGLPEEDAKKEMELLKESFEILSSEEERRLYDWSLGRSENPDRYMWPYETDFTQISPEDPPPGEPENVGPTRLVGYFFLAWLLLSFVLSVTLNR